MGSTTAFAAGFIMRGLPGLVVVSVIVIAIPVLFGWWASAIAKKKGHSVGGYFALGFFLGVIGVIIAAVVSPAVPAAPPGMRSVACPRCNARQNVYPGAGQFECWQCRTTSPLPA
jgi:hypothetical protein